MQTSDNIIKIECMQHRLNVDKDGIATVAYRAPYNEAVNYIQLIPMLGLDVSLGVKSKDENSKFEKIGMVRIKSLSIDKEGQATIQFYGDIECMKASGYHDKILIIAVKEKQMHGGSGE